ncbi:MAG: calcium/sodium antiporter [Pseudomonadota bacterium]
MIDAILVVVGLFALVVGGDLVVRGAVSVARKLNVSPMVIGMTLVGFGTSLPELVTSLQAAFAGSPGIAVGNVVGSNIANILLILGLSALIAPILINPSAFRRDSAMLVGVTAVSIAVLVHGDVSRLAALLLLACFAAYIFIVVRVEGSTPTDANAVYEGEAGLVDTPTLSGFRSMLDLVGGFAILVAGAHSLITGAVSIATDFQVPDAIIGLTIVAIGTSLPELVTSAVAARRGQGDIAFGNIIGSNIFNLLAILGTTAAVFPFTAPAEIAAFDVWVMGAVTLLLLVFARTGWRIGRREGGFLLALYIGYTGYLISLP